MANNWSLKQLYNGYDDPAIKQDLKQIENFADELLEMTSYIESDEAFAKIIEKRDQAMKTAIKLMNFSTLSSAVNTEDADARKLYTEIVDIIDRDALVSARIYEYIANHEDIDALINGQEYLKPVEFVIREMKKESAHRLPEETEYLIERYKNDGASAFSDLFELLTSTLETEMDGKTYTLSEIRNFATDKSQKVRRDAYEAELKCYKKIEKSVATALTSIKGWVITNAEARGYESPLMMTLEETRMKKSTLDALISSIEKNLPMLRRIYKAKAKALGHKNGALPFYDLDAPLGEEKTYTYEEAQKIVIDAYSTFSEKMADTARRAFREHWVDVEPRHSKVGGAFCQGLTSIGEYRVLTNFTGSFEGVITFAHELGHGYHAIVIKDERIMNLSYPMSLAETASTFCETLTYNMFLDKKADLALLNTYLSKIASIIIDIYSRYLFETRAFEERKYKKPSAKDYMEYMIEAQKQAYGDSLDEDVMHPYMWACKGHYYSAGLSFYNFPYAFGQLFSTGLYQLFKKDPEGFKPKYDELLIKSGSAYVEDVCGIVGIDPGTEEFWQSSFDAYEKLIEQFEAIVEEEFGK